MPSSSSTGSFIPKRGPARRQPKTKKQIFLFTIIAYSLLFAALLAAAGTYLYKNYLTSQLQSEVTSLNTAVQTFSIEDLSRVYEFDVRLRRAANRVDHTASVVAILDELSRATIKPAQFQSLSVERQGDSQFKLAGEVLTDTFDAALFQRKIYSANRELFPTITITDVTIIDQSVEEEPVVAVSVPQVVTFSLTIDVPVEEVLVDPAAVRMPQVGVVGGMADVVSAAAADAASSVADDVVDPAAGDATFDTGEGALLFEEVVE